MAVPSAIGFYKKLGYIHEDYPCFKPTDKELAQQNALEARVLAEYEQAYKIFERQCDEDFVGDKKTWTRARGKKCNELDIELEKIIRQLDMNDDVLYEMELCF